MGCVENISLALPDFLCAGNDGIKFVHTFQESGRLFEWVDGPLVVAMKQGGVILLDEISLADDSVLERLNSVLEPERLLLLAEKGGDTETITAHENFRVLATMNPGGDYGKKEVRLGACIEAVCLYCYPANAI